MWMSKHSLVVELLTKAWWQEEWQVTWKSGSGRIWWSSNLTAFGVESCLASTQWGCNSSKHLRNGMIAYAESTWWHFDNNLMTTSPLSTVQKFEKSITIPIAFVNQSLVCGFAVAKRNRRRHTKACWQEEWQVTWKSKSRVFDDQVTWLFLVLKWFARSPQGSCAQTACCSHNALTEEVVVRVMNVEA